MVRSPQAHRPQVTEPQAPGNGIVQGTIGKEVEETPNYPDDKAINIDVEQDLEAEQAITESVSNLVGCINKRKSLGRRRSSTTELVKIQVAYDELKKLFEETQLQMTEQATTMQNVLEAKTKIEKKLEQSQAQAKLRILILSVVPKPLTSTTVNPTTSDTTNSYNLAGVPRSSKVPATNDNYFPACLPVEDIYPRQSAPSTSSTRNPDNLEGVPGSSVMNQAFGTLSMQDQEKKPKKRKSKDKSSPKTPKKVKQKSNDDKSKPATPRAKQKLHKVATPPNVAPMSRQGGLQNVKNPNFGGVSATWTGSFTVPSIPATVFNPVNLWINGTLVTPTNQPNIVWTNGNNPSQVTVQQTGNVTNINFTKRTTKVRKSKSPRIPKMNIYSNPIDASTPFPKDHKPMVRTKLISVPEFIKPTEGIEPETIKLFLPETWSCHQDFELPGCKVVQLPKAHPEYLEVVEIIGRTLNRPIKNIHCIENPYLLTMFLLKKAELITRYGHCSEQLLFHGTNSANVYNIAVNNLDWRRYGKNVGHVYGCGVYFGSTAAVSNVYAKNSMFLVRVLIYWTEHGANDTSVPAIGIDTTTSTCGNITVKFCK
ncbi:hypothetical protein B566_EDAN018393 [Ephemera danica]|nr:hypothetical protein B566_EDAN018393 [Ephemera danica]